MTTIMAFQEIGDGAVKAEQNIKVEKTSSRVSVKHTLLWWQSVSALFLPKTIIKVTIFNNYDFMIKMVSKVMLVSINGEIFVFKIYINYTRP